MGETPTGHINLELTADEVRELFSRCLSSPEPDNSVSRDAMLKLAKVLDQHGEPVSPIALNTKGVV